MTQSNPAQSQTLEQPGAGHEKSASTTLTGRAVLFVWLISVLLHGGGLALMFVVVFPYASRGQEELPLAHVDIVGSIDPKPVIAPQPELSAEPQEIDPLQARVAPKPNDALSDIAMSKKPELSIIGIGTGGGDFSKYGLTAGKGKGPEFFGLGGSVRGARRIVYVVDRSGSMLDTFVHVREELKRSIGALRRSQKFHVIFFNSGEPLENPPKRLVSAISAQKTAFFSFLDNVFPEGSTHPGRALRRALAVEPDLIYFLTDGDFDADVVDKLDQWNADRRVRIFTIAFFDRSGADLLERIAREHGGEFKFVSDDDLP